MHSLPLRVYYEDTDAGGIVYHANYLRFAERGRAEFLRAVGISSSQMHREEGILIVVRRIEGDYLRPARLDDALDVRTRLDHIGNTRIVLKQDVVRAGEVCCALTVVLVCIDRAGKPVRVPTGLREALENSFPATA